jgi:drug/metabolite transporter (DMT)-like permease
MSDKSEHEHVARAAAWLVLGVTSGLALDLCGKKLLESWSLNQFVLLRSGVAIVILLAIAPRFGGFATFRSKRIRWHAARMVFSLGAMFGFFYGLANLPLVNALTLGFTAPLIMTALSATFLGDDVGWRRWSAVLVGFGGVLIILRPDGSGMTLPAFAVLGAAFCYACQAITARHLSGTETTLALSFWVLVGPFVFAAVLTNEGNWVTPDATGWLLVVAAGFFSVIAWIGLVNGYRSASPATLAPLEYLALVGGTIAGYLLWDEVPDRWVVVGAIVIVASGLFVVYRGEARDEVETCKARRRPP